MAGNSEEQATHGSRLSNAVRNLLADLFIPRGILSSSLDVTYVSIPVSNLPVELDGYTIAQVSDLHVGEAKHWAPRWGTGAADAIRDAAPQVIVNTGDFVWNDPPAFKAGTIAAQFVMHAGDGVTAIPSIAILGNHDYYTSERSRRELVQELRAAGVCVLTNESFVLQHAGERVSFVGITDEEDSFALGTEALLAAPHPRVALVHVPDLAENLPYGAADLVLSGHTHGGQFTLPFLEKAIVRRGCGSNYVEGLYTINGMPVYVNRGLGYTGYPVRFRARPEVSLLRLTR